MTYVDPKLLDTIRAENVALGKRQVMSPTNS